MAMRAHHINSDRVLVTNPGGHWDGWIFERTAVGWVSVSQAVELRDPENALMSEDLKAVMGYATAPASDEARAFADLALTSLPAMIRAAGHHDWTLNAADLACVRQILTAYLRSTDIPPRPVIDTPDTRQWALQLCEALPASMEERQVENFAFVRSSIIHLRKILKTYVDLRDVVPSRATFSSPAPNQIEESTAGMVARLDALQTLFSGAIPSDPPALFVFNDHDCRLLSAATYRHANFICRTPEFREVGEALIEADPPKQVRDLEGEVLAATRAHLSDLRAIVTAALEPTSKVV